MSIGDTVERSALAGLERTIDHLLALDPDSSARLAPLAGKAIELHVRGLDLRFCIAPDDTGVRLLPSGERTPDTTISGTPMGLARNWLSRDARQEMFEGDVTVSGETELAQDLKRLLDELDIDWEEQFSRLAGDVVAHQAGNLVRDVGRWSADSADSLRQDVSEWLHEESRLLPSRPEVEQFLAAVDVLRADVDRLEQRVRRLLDRHAERGIPR